MGTVHEVAQGEGGEQGDAIMPLLVALGQHPALEAPNRQLRPGELLFAYLDDTYVVCLPDRVGMIFTLLETALWEHVRIQVHAGKTMVWNRAGTRPEACDFLERRAQLVSEQQARVWRGGDDVLSVERGVKILGTPLGNPECVSHQLRVVREHQQVLLDRIPDLPDVQSAWALFVVALRGCPCNCFIRVVPPELSQEFANSHDEALWRCLSAVLGVPPTLYNPCVRDTITLPLAFGGMGLRSASRTVIPACWASWGDALNMIASVTERHRVVAATLVELAGRTRSAHLSAAVHATDQLIGLDGFDIPGWADLASGAQVAIAQTKPQQGWSGSIANET